ncbi:hemolysin family protein [Phocaeicola sp.]
MGSIIIQILITMAFSAFFSGMEIAFVSSNKLRFEMDRSSQSITSRILSIFFHNPNNFISTMLVGNNIALVIYGILMAQVIEQNILSGLIENHFLLVLIQTIISTLIILVTGEFLPKTLFKINPNLTLNLLAIPTFICYIILYPISKFASGVSSLLLRILGIKVNKEASEKAFTKVDLDYFIQSSIQDADNEQEIDTEIKIFQNALDFSNIKIRDCMVPRTEIVAIEYGTSMEELKARFVESGISKVIVYKENIDNIVGYIHSSEMFRELTDWTKCIRQLPIVPETMSAHKLMKLFMQQKKSLAVVVDEFGGTSGIVALEDLVEEIFGEIEDEHDTTSYIAKAIGNNEYILSGRLEIEKANELFPIDLPESDEYQTVGGLILHQYQSFPKLHEVISFSKFQFKIIKVTATKIELVKLKVME